MNRVHNTILQKRPPTAIDCVSIILIDKPRLKNVYKANCTDLVCFSSYLTFTSSAMFISWKWNGPKELESSEATYLAVRSTDGTGETFM